MIRDPGPAGEDTPGPRVMGLDFGERRIGIALSDPLGLLALPLMTLERRSWAFDLGALAGLAREHEVGRIVVGLPLGMDGQRGAQVTRVEDFIARVHGATGLPVDAWDERLTTAQAERSLLEADLSRARRRKAIDRVAAVILLQSYLDARKSAERT